MGIVSNHTKLLENEVAGIKYFYAFLIFIGVFIIFFSPVIFRGEVIFPHNNDLELGEPLAPDPSYISNGKFADESSFTIPEVNNILRSRHRAWIATWNPNTELGRPTFQIGGMSRVYLPSNIIAFFTTDPFLFYTLTILLTVFLTGLFLFLLLKSLDISPVACLIASLGLSFGFYLIYWSTYNILLSPYCWTLGLMWLSRRFIQRPTLALALGIAFFSYSLLLTGYQQLIFFHLYILTGFILVLLWRMEGEIKKKIRIAVMLAGAALFGVLMTTPLYLDIMETASRSARLAAGNDFFLKDFPKINRIDAFLIFINSLFNAFIFGNPMVEKYQFVFNWPSLTPLYSALFLSSFMNGLWRRLWPWHAFILVCAVATVSPGVYLFAVRHMGFNMSAVIPIVGGLIPAAVVTAFVADYLIREDKGGGYLKKAIVFLSFLPLGILYILYTKNMTILIKPHYLILNLAIVIFFYALSTSRSRYFKTYGLLALAIVTVFVYTRSLKLIRPESNIHTTSMLVKFIKEQTADGSRLAFVGFKNLIPANQESLVGLRSIHAYDSLSSKEYQRLVKKLSLKGTFTYGRHFDYITDGSRLGIPEFSYTGIGLYIASMELQNPGLVPIARWHKYRFYKTKTRPLLEAQVADYELKNGGAIISGRLEGHETLSPRRLDNYTDYKTYSLTPVNRPTLLFMSEQYHPRWRARSRSGPLRTVMVNDFYEGVIIPPGTVEAILEFRPFVLWMWVPQVIFIIFVAALAMRYFIVRKKSETRL